MKNSCIALSGAVVRWSLLSALFLVPLFFLPFTLYPVDLGKQFIFTALMLIAGIAYLSKSFAVGKLEYAKSRMSWALLALGISSLLSTIFSSARAVSVMGTTGGEADVMLSIISFALFAFLFSAEAHDERWVKRAFFAVMASGTLVALFALSKVIGLSLFPWQFAQGVGFNTIGTTNALALYLGFIAVIGFAASYYHLVWNKAVRAWCGIVSVLAFLLAFLMGYWPLYAGIIASVLTLAWLDARSAVIKGPRRQAVPLAIIAVSLLIGIVSLGFISIPLPRLNTPAEIAPSISASFKIAKQTAREGVTRALFGSGPATYQYQYGKYRSAELNATPFWNVRFSQGFNAIFTHLVSMGLLGTLSLLAVVWFFLLEALGLVRITKAFEPMHAVFGAGGVYLLLMLFLYPQNFVLYALLFACMGVMVSFHAERKGGRGYLALSGEGQYAPFARSVVASVAVIALLGLLYADARRYVAAMIFERGVALAVDEKQIDAALALMARGSNMDAKNDAYLGILANAMIVRADMAAGEAGTTPSEEAKARVASLVLGGVSAAERGAQANPANVSAWLSLARIYEAVIPLNPSVAQGAFAAYGAAQKLEPNNPAIFSAEGVSHAAYALRLTGASRATEYQAAIAALKKALELKPDYADALYLLALVYDSAGNRAQAIESLQAVLRLDPSNKQVPPMIENLKAGKSALSR